MTRVRVVNPYSEFYVDGLYFYKLSKSKKNMFLRWRYLRVSIIMTYSALEAAINKSSVSQTSTNKQQVKKLLKMPNMLFSLFGIKFVPILEKIPRTVELWKEKFDFTQSIEKENWDNFLALKKTREAVAHYRSNKETGDRIYKELVSDIKIYQDTAHYMMCKVFPESVVNGWEKNLIPYDATIK